MPRRSHISAPAPAGLSDLPRRHALAWLAASGALHQRQDLGQGEQVPEAGLLRGRLAPDELLLRVTGNELTIQPYLAYLQRKYSQLYGPLPAVR